MKKVFLALIAVMAIGTSTTFAQKAIGLRFGGGSLLGAEISYQQDMGANRLEGDLGFSFGDNSSYISAVGIYQWKWNIVSGLNWYVGPGVALGLYMSDIADYSGFSLGVGGQIGLEYDFSTLGVPLLLSVDARPMWNVVRPAHYGGFGWGTCLSLRYLF